MSILKVGKRQTYVSPNITGFKNKDSIGVVSLSDFLYCIEASLTDNSNEFIMNVYRPYVFWGSVQLV